MKIFGHPLHMMLIHFPAALFPMDLVCSLLYFLGGAESLGASAAYATFGGAVIGWLAIITGAIDVLAIIKNKPALISKAVIHGSINTLTVIGFSVFALRSSRQYPDFEADSILVLIVKAVLVGIMFAGNYLGGSLVLKDGVATSNN